MRRGALTIDGEKMQTTWNGAPVTLSLTEFWIVHALARNPGHVKNRQQLMDAANVVLDDNTITSHIKRRAPQIPPGRSGLRRHPDRLRNGLSLGRVSIRLQLLIVALTTLMLPWAGCQYARELETALRVSQENAARGERRHHRQCAVGATAASIPRSGRHRAVREPEGDLYVYPLHAQPLLDGYREDWDIAADPEPLPSRGGLGARVQAGFTERYLYLYLEVDDPHFDAEPRRCASRTRPFRPRRSHACKAPTARWRSYFFATSAPGLIAAQTVVQGRRWHRAHACERAAHPGLLAAGGSRLPPGGANAP